MKCDQCGREPEELDEPCEECGRFIDIDEEEEELEELDFSTDEAFDEFTRQTPPWDD